MILYFSRCHFLDDFTIFSLVFLVKLKMWRICQRIKYSIFSGLIWKGWGHQLKSNFKVFPDENIPWRYGWNIPRSIVSLKLGIRRRILQGDSKEFKFADKLNFFVYEYKGMKYSNFKYNKHGRLNKLYVNSEENF